MAYRLAMLKKGAFMDIIHSNMGISIKIKQSISSLLFELVETYVRAKWEDAGSPSQHPYISVMDQWDKSTICVSRNEAKYLLKVCNEVADPYLYDSMHSSTKRGYKKLADKLTKLIQ
jgi:hypothetical protein